MVQINMLGQYDKGPSFNYEIFRLFVLSLLICDIVSDWVFGLFSMFTGRIVQGCISIMIITFPVLQHLTSDVYKRQDSLVAVGEMSYIYWEAGLSRFYSALDPIIWAYNHYRYSQLYRANPENEQTRRNFYISKQMAHLSAKNEAQLESSYQGALTFFVFLHYYNEYTIVGRILLIATLFFSCVSVSCAACTDLLKTKVKCENPNFEYIRQSTGWRVLRLISVCLVAGATLIANTTFLFCLSHWLTATLNLPFPLTLFISCMLNLWFNTCVQVIWSLVNDRIYFKKNYHCNNCWIEFGKRFQAWFHFVNRSPLINIFRSQSLYTYSLPFPRFLICLSINSISLFTLFTPFAILGPEYVFYVPINLLFTIFIVCSFLCGIIVKLLVNPVNLNELETKIYHLP